jgi:hypothetical protein
LGARDYNAFKGTVVEKLRSLKNALYPLLSQRRVREDFAEKAANLRKSLLTSLWKREGYSAFSRR